MIGLPGSGPCRRDDSPIQPQGMERESSANESPQESSLGLYRRHGAGFHARSAILRLAAHEPLIRVIELAPIE
jgi:hypothetical protein